MSKSTPAHFSLSTKFQDHTKIADGDLAAVWLNGGQEKCASGGMFWSIEIVLYPPPDYVPNE